MTDELIYEEPRKQVSVHVEGIEVILDILSSDPGQATSPKLVDLLVHWTKGDDHDADLAGGLILRQQENRLTLTGRHGRPTLAEMQRVVNNYAQAAGWEPGTQLLVTEPTSPPYTLCVYLPRRAN